MTSVPDLDDFDDPGPDECHHCLGEGGYNACMEDCCPAVGGEDGCTDPACWRVCSVCRGETP